MRYPDGGHSVGDNTWLLKKDQPRPVLPEAQVLSQYILEQLEIYPPYLVLDLHEDTLSRPNGSYVYTYAKTPNTITSLIEQCFIANQLPLVDHGRIRVDETIDQGLVKSSYDHSIDHLLASHLFHYHHQHKLSKPYTKHIYTVETDGTQPLSKRVTCQMTIIWHLLRQLQSLN